MSHNSNTELLTRASELAEEMTSTTMGKVLAQAIDDYDKTKDLDALRATTAVIEGQLAQTHFNEADIVEPQEMDCER